MDMTKKARDAYIEMVGAVEKEIAEANRGSAAATSNMPTIADVPRFFSHMGHSRTPSGCSGISLTSSILSEPISENYPYSEPETDSRGFEVYRRRDGSIMHQSLVAQQPLLAGATRADAHAAVGGETLDEKLQKIDQDLKELDEQSKVSSTANANPDNTLTSPRLREVDEGNEADTEDDVIQAKPAADDTAYDSERVQVNIDGVMNPDELPGAKDKTLLKARVEEWMARTQEQVERLDIAGDEGESESKSESGDNDVADSDAHTPSAPQLPQQQQQQ